jgi:hypothetical protein
MKSLDVISKEATQGLRDIALNTGYNIIDIASTYLTVWNKQDQRYFRKHGEYIGIMYAQKAAEDTLAIVQRYYRQNNIKDK